MDNVKIINLKNYHNKWYATIELNGKTGYFNNDGLTYRELKKRLKESFNISIPELKEIKEKLQNWGFEKNYFF